MRLPPDPDPRAPLRGLHILVLFVLTDAHGAVLRDPRHAAPLLAWLALLPVWVVMFALVYGRGEQDERVRFVLDEVEYLPTYVRRWLEDLLGENAHEGRKGAR